MNEKLAALNEYVDSLPGLSEESKHQVKLNTMQALAKSIETASDKSADDAYLRWLEGQLEKAGRESFTPMELMQKRQQYFGGGR